MAKLYPQLSAVRTWSRSTVADGLTFQQETMGVMTRNIKTIWDYLMDKGINDLPAISASAMSAASAYSYLSDWMPGNPKGNPTLSDIQTSADHGMSAWTYCSADHYFVGLENSAISGGKAWEKLSGYMDPSKPSYMGKIQTSAGFGASAWDALRDYPLADVNKSAYSAANAYKVLTANQSDIEYLYNNDAIFRNMSNSSEDVYNVLEGSTTNRKNLWNAFSVLINQSASRMTDAYNLCTANSANWNELYPAYLSAKNCWDKNVSYTNASATLLDKMEKYVSDSATNLTQTWHDIYDENATYAPSSNADIWNGMANKDTSWWLTWLCQANIKTKWSNWNAAYNTLNADGHDKMNLADSFTDTYETVETCATEWDKVVSYDYSDLNETNWNKTYTAVKAGSADWRKGYTGWTADGEVIAEKTTPFCKDNKAQDYNDMYDKLSATNTTITVAGKSPTRNTDAWNAVYLSAQNLSSMYKTVADNSGKQPTSTDNGKPKWEYMLSKNFGKTIYEWQTVGDLLIDRFDPLTSYTYSNWNDALNALNTPANPEKYSSLTAELSKPMNQLYKWDDWNWMVPGDTGTDIKDWWTKWLTYDSTYVRNTPIGTTKITNPRLRAFSHTTYHYLPTTTGVIYVMG